MAAAEGRWVRAAHDVSDGGLRGGAGGDAAGGAGGRGLGLEADLGVLEAETAAALFSERAGIVFEVSPERSARLFQAARERGAARLARRRGAERGRCCACGCPRARPSGRRRSCAGRRRGRSSGCGTRRRRRERARVAVLQFPGVNCEAETVRALERAGLRGRGLPLDAAGRGAARLRRPTCCRAASPSRTGCAPARWPRRTPLVERAGGGGRERGQAGAGHLQRRAGAGRGRAGAGRGAGGAGAGAEPHAGPQRLLRRAGCTCGSSRRPACSPRALRAGHGRCRCRWRTARAASPSRRRRARWRSCCGAGRCRCATPTPAAAAGRGVPRQPERLRAGGGGGVQRARATCWR